MKFYTQSGSCYEIDPDSRKARQIFRSVETASETKMSDGEWWNYIAMYPELPKIGGCVYIFREDLKATVTSPVVSLEN